MDALLSAGEYLSRILDSSDPTAPSGKMWQEASLTFLAIQSEGQDETSSSSARDGTSSISALCDFKSLTITPEGPHSILISDFHHLKPKGNIHRNCLATLLAVAVQLPLVNRVYRRVRPQINNFMSAQTIQTGSRFGGTPYHDRGLNGTGQIVGNCDTGLDLWSCFFEEPDRSMVRIQRKVQVPPSQLFVG